MREGGGSATYDGVQLEVTAPTFSGSRRDAADVSGPGRDDLVALPARAQPGRLQSHLPP